MMKVDAVKKESENEREDRIRLTTAMSFAELVAMDARGELFREDRQGRRVILPFYDLEIREIREDGKVICEGDELTKQFDEFLENRTGKNRVDEDRWVPDLCYWVQLFAGAQDRLDAKRFEIVFQVKTKYAETDSFEATETEYLYKQLRERILVKGERQLRICGNEENKSNIRKTVLHLANELGNLAYAAEHENPLEIIALHPGYTYEDFMEKVVSLRGTRDTIKGLRDTTDLVRVDGVFKEFCSNACRKPGLPHIFVIENYDMVSEKVLFGEALYGMLPEYREDGIRIRTMYQSYPGSAGNDPFANGFFIPENVVIMGICSTSSCAPDPVISKILP